MFGISPVHGGAQTAHQKVPNSVNDPHKGAAAHRLKAGVAGRQGRGAGDIASCLAIATRQGRRAVASMALPRGYERVARKYVCGVVPIIVRNISMKALTLS